MFLAILGGLYFFQTHSSITSWDDHDKELEILQKHLIDLGHEIQENTPPPECRESEQCKVVGLGVKTCGEFATYFIYSTTTVSELHILKLVEKYNEESEKVAKITLLVPECGQPPRPVACISQRCTLTQ